MSVLDQIRNMRQQTKEKETKLIKTKSYSGFLRINDLDEGKTTLRIVKHPNDKIPFYPFRSTWLEVEESIENLSKYHLEKIVEEKKLEKILGIKKISELKDVDEEDLRKQLIDELGKGFKKSLNKRVFISKIHGNPEIPDIIEEYIKFANQMIKGYSQDTEETKRLMSPIRGYKDKSGKWIPGIMPGTSFVCYLYNLDDSDIELKRFEMWEKHMNEIEKLYSSFDESDEPLTIDPFSDMKEGVPLVFEKFKNEKNKFDYSIADKKLTSRTMTFKDFVKQFQLTPEQLKEIESVQPLSEIYLNSYGRRDFELALNGLQIFDEKNKIGVFANDEFIDIIEEIAKHYENEQEEENPVKQEKAKPEKPTSKKVEKEEEPESAEESPYGDSIDELKVYIKKNKLGIRVTSRMSFEDVVEAIEEVEAEIRSEEPKNKVETGEDHADGEDEKTYAEEDSFEEKKEAGKPSVDLETLRARLRRK